MQMRPATRGSARIASAKASSVYVRRGCAQASCNSSVVTSHETSRATAVSKNGRCPSSHAAVRASASRAAKPTDNGYMAPILSTKPALRLRDPQGLAAVGLQDPLAEPVRDDLVETVDNLVRGR